MTLDHSVRCASIGYQQKSIDRFCALLNEYGVERLIDVRARAWSQRPQYRRTALADSLRAAGVEYIHCKAAGNPYRPTPGETVDSVDCAQRYLKHLRANPDVLAHLAQMMAEKLTALFCYERSSDDCHRGVILNELRARDASLEVVEIA